MSGLNNKLIKIKNLKYFIKQDTQGLVKHLGNEWRHKILFKLIDILINGIDKILSKFRPKFLDIDSVSQLFFLAATLVIYTNIFGTPWCLKGLKDNKIENWRYPWFDFTANQCAAAPRLRTIDLDDV